MAEELEPDEGPTARAAWMATLAKADRSDLERQWTALCGALPAAPSWQRLRGPETGMVMVRGRAGGDGRRFNLGEMTVTRCTVRLPEGQVGHAYVAGRDPRHAELAAVVDALMQDPARAEAVDRAILAPLAARQAARRDLAARKANATKVEFFTLVRGED